VPASVSPGKIIVAPLRPAVSQQLSAEIVLYLPVAEFSMSIVSTIVIGFLTVVTYGLPFFLGWQWIRKLSNFEENPPTPWRGISLWVGLSACTIAVGAFWFGLFTNPHTYPQEDIHFRRFLMFDKAAVAIGIGGSLVGQGKGRWLVVLSGLGVGASWLWFAVLQ
jgi:hypothetical protein